MGDKGGPAIYWSVKNPLGYPKWVADDNLAPYCSEMTTAEGVGDAWVIREKDSTFKTLTTSDLANKIANAIIELAAENQ